MKEIEYRDYNTSISIIEENCAYYFSNLSYSDDNFKGPKNEAWRLECFTKDYKNGERLCIDSSYYSNGNNCHIRLRIFKNISGSLYSEDIVRRDLVLDDNFNIESKSDLSLLEYLNQVHIYKNINGKCENKRLKDGVLVDFLKKNIEYNKAFSKLSVDELCKESGSEGRVLIKVKK